MTVTDDGCPTGAGAGIPNEVGHTTNGNGTDSDDPGGVTVEVAEPGAVETVVDEDELDRVAPPETALEAAAVVEEPLELLDGWPPAEQAAVARLIVTTAASARPELFTAEPSCFVDLLTRAEGELRTTQSSSTVTTPTPEPSASSCDVPEFSVLSIQPGASGRAP